jgi:hypothetical protein
MYDAGVDSQRAYNMKLRDFSKFGSMVYYMKFSDRVKIGTSIDLKRRLEEVTNDCLMATEPGDTVTEKERHSQFKQYHIRGDWFELSDAIIEHITCVRNKYPNFPRTLTYRNKSEHITLTDAEMLDRIKIRLMNWRHDRHELLRSAHTVGLSAQETASLGEIDLELVEQVFQEFDTPAVTYVEGVDAGRMDTDSQDEQANVWEGHPHLAPGAYVCGPEFIEVPKEESSIDSKNRMVIGVGAPGSVRETLDAYRACDEMRNDLLECARTVCIPAREVAWRMGLDRGLVDEVYRQYDTEWEFHAPANLEDVTRLSVSLSWFGEFHAKLDIILQSAWILGVTIAEISERTGLDQDEVGALLAQCEWGGTIPDFDA